MHKATLLPLKSSQNFLNMEANSSWQLWYTSLQYVRQSLDIGFNAWWPHVVIQPNNSIPVNLKF